MHCGRGSSGNEQAEIGGAGRFGVIARTSRRLSTDWRIASCPLPDLSSGDKSRFSGRARHPLALHLHRSSLSLFLHWNSAGGDRRATSAGPNEREKGIWRRHFHRPDTYHLRFGKGIAWKPLVPGDHGCHRPDYAGTHPSSHLALNRLGREPPLPRSTFSFQPALSLDS